MIVFDDSLGRTGNKAPIERCRLDFMDCSVRARDLISARVELEYDVVQKRVAEVHKAIEKDFVQDLWLLAYEVDKHSPFYGSSPHHINDDENKKLHPASTLEDAVKSALEAFESNRYLLFVDDIQITDLEAPLNIQKTSTATFFQLLPLQGG